MTRAQQALKILFFYDCLFPQTLGGVEHRNLEMARELGKLGHQVVLAGFGDSRKGVAPGVEVLSVGPRKPLYSTAGKRKTTESLRLAAAAARLDLKPFDVIETANIPYLHLFPLSIRCRRLGKPLLVTWYELWGRYWREYLGPVKWLPYALVEWMAAYCGSRFLASSSLTGERLARRRQGLDVRVVPCGVPVERIRDAATGAGDRVAPILYAGRLQKEKRVDLLLRAIPLLPASRDHGLVEIIGSGPDRERLESLSLELGVQDRVTFLGKLGTVEAVWSRLARARMAVQPSEREGFGLFPLEAMALGRPVVYCRSPESAVSELVRDGQEGIASEPEPQALADALCRLLQDDALHRRMSHQAALRADSYDWPVVARQFEAEVAGALEGRR